MGNENPLSNRNEAEKRKRLANFVKVLTGYFEKWKLVFPTHEISKEQLAVYLEALDDLSLLELLNGCREVIKTAANFPKPSEIIAAAKRVYEEPLSGPKMLEYQEISKEEREEALKATEAIKKALTAGSPAKPAPVKRIVHVTKSIEEQKEELRKRGYIQ